MATTIRSAYRELVERGEIQPDPGQEAGLEALARLGDELNALGEPSFLARFQGRREPPRGVYLWGPVGRGKSMLMDLFFETAPVEKKRRDHFYAFMAEVHRMLNAWRKDDAAGRRSRGGQARDTEEIAFVASRIASNARLLCFDELLVADIADAMILGRLFEALFTRGVVLVATSNRAPDELYKDGINRQLFLPFIDMLKERLEVVHIAGERDHRLERLKGARVYFSPITPETEAAFDALWRDQLDGARETGETLEVMGRKIHFPRSVRERLRTSFASLCGQALGAQDYLAVAARFRVVFLEGVPRLGRDRADEAQRFTKLIETLYLAKTRLVVLAEAEPSDLCSDVPGFERAVSRLEEMRAADWMNGG